MRVEGRCDHEIVRSCPLLRKVMSQARAQCFAPGWIYAGEMFDFSWRRLAAPISHAVAAEIARNDESAGKRHFVLALHQETAVPRVSGSKVRYSTAAGDDGYSFFSGAIQPGSQMENACRASCHTCTH